MFLSQHSTALPPGGAELDRVYARHRATVQPVKVPRVRISAAHVRAYGPVRVCRTRRPSAQASEPSLDPTRLGVALACVVFWCVVAVACCS